MCCCCIICTISDTHLYLFMIKESKGPKAVIAIKDLNATLQPEKIGHPHGLQITYQNDNHTRSLYVYHESSEVGLHCYSEVSCWCHPDYSTKLVHLRALSVSSSTLGNSLVVQCHPCCSLRVPEDCVSNRKR